MLFESNEVYFQKDTRGIKNFVHWLVVNIPGNNVSKGETKRQKLKPI